MNQKEYKLFERLKTLGDAKFGDSDKKIDKEARIVIEKIKQTNYYKQSPNFCRQLIIKYNFYNLIEDGILK